MWRARRRRGRETTTKPYSCVLEGGATKPSARPVATRRADGGCGRSLRCSSSKMAKHRLPPPALTSPHKPHLHTSSYLWKGALSHHFIDTTVEKTIGEGKSCCRPALSSELGVLLLINQVVRSVCRAGLRNVGSSQGPSDLQNLHLLLLGYGLDLLSKLVGQSLCLFQASSLIVFPKSLCSSVAFSAVRSHPYEYYEPQPCAVPRFFPHVWPDLSASLRSAVESESE